MTGTPLMNKAQSGVVLVVCLIMLALLTLLGLTGVQTTGLEEKMAGNLRNQNLAFQAAESALSVAESTLVPVAPDVLPTFTVAGNGGFYIKTGANMFTDPVLNQPSFWTTNPVATSSVTGLGNNISAPKYIIEKLPASCYKASCPTASELSQPYRITVRATGASAETVVILQSVFTP